jgi:hypothetical protein
MVRRARSRPSSRRANARRQGGLAPRLRKGKRKDHAASAPKRLSPKAQKNVVDLFRAFVRRLADDGVIARTPKFPLIHVPEVEIQTIDTQEQDRVLAAIEWERRGAFLACAS